MNYAKLIADLKIETIDRQPKGGQHAGTLSPEIQVTHIPTGLMARCHSERSQLRNRNICLAMIEYGLAEMGWEI